MTELEETGELTGEYGHMSDSRTSDISFRRRTNTAESASVDLGQIQVSEVRVWWDAWLFDRGVCYPWFDYVRKLDSEELAN